MRHRNGPCSPGRSAAGAAGGEAARLVRPRAPHSLLLLLLLTSAASTLLDAQQLDLEDERRARRDLPGGEALLAICDLVRRRDLGLRTRWVVWAEECGMAWQGVGQMRSGRALRVTRKLLRIAQAGRRAIQVHWQIKQLAAAAHCRFLSICTAGVLARVRGRRGVAAAALPDDTPPRR